MDGAGVWLGCGWSPEGSWEVQGDRPLPWRGQVRAALLTVGSWVGGGGLLGVRARARRGEQGLPWLWRRGGGPSCGGGAGRAGGVRAA